jgi:hypothetical protein
MRDAYSAESEESTLFSPFLLFLFLQLFLGFHFRHNLFQRLDRFRFLTLEPLEIDAFDKLRKRSFPGLLSVVVYLAELVGIQSQFTGHLDLFIR